VPICEGVRPFFANLQPLFSFLLLRLLKLTPEMGRMHSGGKGISRSSLPYKRTPPSWLRVTKEEVSDHVCKLAKKGLTPSQIGTILRDSHGIGRVKSVTGTQIARILKANGLAPQIPEDLYFLIKKAVSVRKHLEKKIEKTKMPSSD